MVRLSANISMLFTELPPLERPAAARRAGFEHVESWWPFRQPDPPAEDVDAWVTAIRDAGVTLTALNLYAGDRDAGDHGVLSLPGRREEFRGSLPTLRAIADATGVRFHNALYGVRHPGHTPAEQDAEAAANLAFTAEALSEYGSTILLEPLTATIHPGYPLHVPADALAVAERVERDHGATRLALLYDVYHVAGNGLDVLDTLAEVYPQVGHVQLADHPGRGAPGTGTIDFAALFRFLHERGYAGYAGAEYDPAGPTEPTLSWTSWAATR